MAGFSEFRANRYCTKLKQTSRHTHRMKQKIRDKRALYTNTAGAVHGTVVAKMYITSCIGLQVGISNAENCCKRKRGMLQEAVIFSVKKFGSGILGLTILRNVLPYLPTQRTFLRTESSSAGYFSTILSFVHSCQQKSIGLKFSKSQTGSDVRYSCHHNSSRFTFPIFAHSYRFSGLHSLQSITPRIY